MLWHHLWRRQVVSSAAHRCQASFAVLLEPALPLSQSGSGDVAAVAGQASIAAVGVVLHPGQAGAEYGFGIYHQLSIISAYSTLNS